MKRMHVGSHSGAASCLTSEFPSGLGATGSILGASKKKKNKSLTFFRCWSNYLGRLPQLPTNIITVPKFEVFPNEDAETWCAYNDSGFSQANAQPARTRAVARQISKLCEISNDLMTSFYNPIDMDKSKGKQQELKKLSELHQRLEAWRRDLPKELEPREGGLPSMLVMQ